MFISDLKGKRGEEKKRVVRATKKNTMNVEKIMSMMMFTLWQQVFVECTNISSLSLYGNLFNSKSWVCENL
jgi:hypothetical protein